MLEKNTVDTAYGLVDRQALEHLQHSFDTRRLLDTVNALDRVRSRICEADGLRQEVLTLHGMAHALLNGTAHPAGSASTAPIWELAEQLASALLEDIEELEGAYEVLNALTALAPSEEWEDEEAEDAREDN
jgi:hypothetical protein